MKDFNYLPANLHSFQAKYVCVCVRLHFIPMLLLVGYAVEAYWNWSESGIPRMIVHIRNGIRQYHTDYNCTWGGCIEVPFLNTVQLFTHYLN